MNYESYEVVPSELQDGVTYTVTRMSFGRRLELMRRVRDLAPKLECFRAGSTQQDKLEAGVLSAEIDLLYLEWGLSEISGLHIDGMPATPLSLARSGPEPLFHEALKLVMGACRLSGPEIKN
jgi:hypothetical protein